MPQDLLKGAEGGSPFLVHFLHRPESLLQIRNINHWRRSLLQLLSSSRSHQGEDIDIGKLLEKLISSWEKQGQGESPPFYGLSDF